MKTAAKHKGEEFPAKGKSAKVVVINEFSTAGRITFPLKVRPTLLDKFRENTIGPIHIAIEHAMTAFLEKVSLQEEGTIFALNAEDFSPNSADLAATRKSHKKTKQIPKSKEHTQEQADEESAD